MNEILNQMSLYADDAVMFADSKQKLLRMVNEFDTMCDRS